MYHSFFLLFHFSYSCTGANGAISPYRLRDMPVLPGSHRCRPAVPTRCQPGASGANSRRLGRLWYQRTRETGRLGGCQLPCWDNWTTRMILAISGTSPWQFSTAPRGAIANRLRAFRIIPLRSPSAVRPKPTVTIGPVETKPLTSKFASRPFRYHVKKATQ